MSFTYAVLGAGRQGAAAAYDMARWGDASRVLVADQDRAVAEIKPICQGTDVTDGIDEIRPWNRPNRPKAGEKPGRGRA